MFSMSRILTLLVLLLPANLQAGDKPHNILFLFSDDQNAQTIAALGNPVIKTPHIDSLYSRGFHFKNAFCMGAMQGAVCVPSRAMLMTGRHLFRVDEKLATQTLHPALFADAGYATYATGKWHNGQPSFARAFQHGKNVFFGGMSNQSAVAVADLKSDGKFTPKRTGPEFSSGLFADTAIEFIRNHAESKTEKPFLLYVPLTQPHDPRTSPPPYDKMYDPAKVPLPSPFMPVHPFDNGDMTLRDEKLLPWPRTDEAIRKETADYYGCITYLDAQLGRILATLRETNQLDNTLIVFASDHGLALGRHGLLGKQSLYDHSMRAPLVFAGPGIKKGSSEAMCYLHDIFPTLMEITGIDRPDSIDGRSLAPLIAGKADKHRDEIVLAYRDVQRALRTDEWKLIVYPKINRTQLFNIKNDPDELADLAKAPEQLERVKMMTARLAKLQGELGDKAPLRSEKPLLESFTPPAK
jgi:arylsulfatase A-like enzyme